MGEFWFGVIWTSIAVGYIGNLFARKTGRNVTMWTIIGVVGNILALVLIGYIFTHYPRVKNALS